MKQEEESEVGIEKGSFERVERIPFVCEEEGRRQKLDRRQKIFVIGLGDGEGDEGVEGTTVIGPERRRQKGLYSSGRGRTNTGSRSQVGSNREKNLMRHMP